MSSPELDCEIDAKEGCWRRLLEQKTRWTQNQHGHRRAEESIKPVGRCQLGGRGDRRRQSGYQKGLL
jgi:hypothetical protein